MIVSASRRTDIPAYYGRWFLRRLHESFCEVPNPFNPRQISRVGLGVGEVEAFVFWSKNPRPFFPVLDALDALGHRYYFQFTLNPYGSRFEPHLPPVEERIETLLALSARLGPKRVVWRYDPIVLSLETPVTFHEEAFGSMAERLRGATVRAMTSLLTRYRKTDRRLAQLEGFQLGAAEPSSPEVARLLESMNRSAAEAGIELLSCAGALPSTRTGRCVDPLLVRELWGVAASVRKDSGQRAACGCAVSRDIGVNDTCLHGCRYCYATRSHALAEKRRAAHDPLAPMLFDPRGA
ncbi:MAG: DUF1848 domain-containing protein [Myxococcales bacterium]|jgi:hypothetical protein